MQSAHFERFGADAIVWLAIITTAAAITQLHTAKWSKLAGSLS